MTTTACVQCHAPSNGQFLDATCTTQLKTWLWELAGHAVDLEEAVIPSLTSRRGEKVMVTGSTEPPQQWNEDASTAAETLRSDLWAIVRDIEERTGSQYPGVDTSASMAAWLARNVMTIALAPDALENYQTVESLAVGYMSVTDKGVDVWKRSIVLCAVDISLPRVWLGRCDAVVDGKTCGQDVKATEDETAVRCSGCMTVRDVADFRVATLVKARKFVGTAAELAAMLPAFVGKPLTRKRITYYGDAGLVERIDNNGDTVYRLGEVVDAHEAFADKRLSRHAA